MAQSRIEALLEALVNGETSDVVPRSRNEAYLKALVEKMSGGGSASAGGGFVVNATVEWEEGGDPTYKSGIGTIDKTFADIYTALENDNVSQCHLYDMGATFVLPVGIFTPEMIGYTIFLNGQTYMVMIMSDGTVTVDLNLAV